MVTIDDILTLNIIKISLDNKWLRDSGAKRIRFIS